jgi:hypothetical protein
MEVVHGDPVTRWTIGIRQMHGEHSNGTDKPPRARERLKQAKARSERIANKTKSTANGLWFVSAVACGLLMPLSPSPAVW